MPSSAAFDFCFFPSGKASENKLFQTVLILWDVHANARGRPQLIALITGIIDTFLLASKRGPRITVAQMWHGGASVALWWWTAVSKQAPSLPQQYVLSDISAWFSPWLGCFIGPYITKTFGLDVSMLKISI